VIDPELLALFLVVSALGTNQLVMRAPGLYESTVIFWLLEALLAAFALFLMVRGLPGFHHLPVVAWVIALLFVAHLVQNYRARLAARHEADLDAGEEARVARAAQIRAALGEREP
jgi:fatty acid desaturase